MAFKKVPGVEDVHVSLEKAFTEVWLQPGNTVTLSQMRDIIRKSGFKPEAAAVVAIGTIEERDGTLVLDLTPAKSVLILKEHAKYPAAFEDVRRMRGTRVELRGSVASDDVMTVESAKQQEPK